MILKPPSGGNGQSRKINAKIQKEDTEGGFGPRGKKHHSQEENINVRAAYIHVIGDLIQSVGVVTAGYVIKFKVIFLYFERIQWCV